MSEPSRIKARAARNARRESRRSAGLARGRAEAAVRDAAALEATEAATTASLSDGGPSARKVSWLETFAIVGPLLFVGLLFRFLLAYVIAPKAGFGPDLGTFTFWADNLADQGPMGFYGRDFFVDYTPGYLYVLWALGALGNVLGDATTTLLKLPAMLADVGIALVAAQLIREIAVARGQVARNRAVLLAAALPLFIPLTWFDSAIWGQVDAVGTLFLLLAARSLIRDDAYRAAGLTAIAILIKPQYLILLPVMAAVAIRRDMLDPIGELRRAGVGLGAALSAIARRGKTYRLVSASLVGIGVAIVLCLPFGLSPAGLIGQVISAGAGYPYITVNAYNPWALFTVDGSGIAASGTWVLDSIQADKPDTPVLLFFGALPAVMVGGFALLAGLALSFQVALRHSDARSILIALSIAALAFFLLPTRVHERYIFPLFAIAAVIAALDRRWLVAYIGAGVAATLNLYVLMTVVYPSEDTPDWLGIGEAMHSTPAVVAIAAVFIATGVFAAVMAVRNMLQKGEGELSPFVIGEAAGDAFITAGASRARSGSSVSASGVAVSAPSSATSASAPAALNGRAPASAAAAPSGPAEGLLGIPFMASLAARFARQPGDRADHRRRERGGRPDRRDALIMLAIFLVAFGGRLWRLDQPAGMYFDEVYHARTAAEFLQDWRYGEPHDIYEFTHPHLAKYAMAAGIAALGAGSGNHVSEATLENPPTDAVVRPATESTPERLFIADGKSLASYASAALDEADSWDTPARKLAVGPDGRLYIATADGGISILDAGADAAPFPVEFLPPEVMGLAPGEQVRSMLVTDGKLLVTTDRAVIAFDAVTRGGLARIAAEDAVGLTKAGHDDAPNSVVVATGTRLTELDPATLQTISELESSAPITGILSLDSVNGRQIYVADGTDSLSLVTFSPDGMVREERTMPGPVRSLYHDPARELIFAIGETPEGEPTAYVIESRGISTFADTPLPFAPTIALVDADPDHKGADHRALVTMDAAGSVASTDIGGYPFAWRLPGALMGALAITLLYLLTRILFRRRTVALFVGALAVLDGLLLVTSRIAMNDVYAYTFIIAAATVFAALWMGHLRGRLSLVLAWPTVGVLLGLALASKWVALYAIGALGILYLVRSASGRALLIVALVGLTALLGSMAINVPSGPTAGPNYLFVLLMIGLTATAAAFATLRPQEASAGESRLLAPVFLVLEAMRALIGSDDPVRDPARSGSSSARPPKGVASRSRPVPAATPRQATLSRRADAPRYREASAPATGIWRPTACYGGAILWVAVCLLVIPVGVYVLSYAPWVALGNTYVGAIPPGGNDLMGLTESMYRYHDGLRATHAAGSPWWAWLLDLKPVWMYAGSDGDWTSSIYAGSNPMVAWLSVAALVMGVVWAATRRTQGLIFALVLFACMWLPWARIDRVSFGYHYATALPFLLILMGYAAAELWHGVTSARALLVAKIATVIALLTPVILWLTTPVLCGLAGTSLVNSGAEVCSTTLATLGSHTGSAILPLTISAMLLVMSYWTLATRNSRNLVKGLTALVAAYAVISYPQWSALDLPGKLGSIYAALLPTYDYSFQFSSNADPVVTSGSIVGPAIVIFMLVVAAMIGAAAYVMRRRVG